MTAWALAGFSTSLNSFSTSQLSDGLSPSNCPNRPHLIGLSVVSDSEINRQIFVNRLNLISKSLLDLKPLLWSQRVSSPYYA